LTLTEEHRLIFENRVLRRISGLKRDEVTGLHNKEFNPLEPSGYYMYHQP
jgi:PAS domain-containing protein